jgi:hypothetical protein
LVREIKQDLTDDRDSAATRHADIETRVRGLERFKWETRGGMAFLAVGLGWLFRVKTGG